MNGSDSRSSRPSLIGEGTLLASQGFAMLSQGVHKAVETLTQRIEAIDERLSEREHSAIPTHAFA
jgi:hypothetical protein